ncbi:MAG: hypothetical protein PHE61_05175, partial [Candidatus Omnitrophica bacterium]|nr:hypothetical protein [Candidatus Omnitrophota bacterium]
MRDASTRKKAATKIWKRRLSFKAVALVTAFLFLFTQSPVVTFAEGEGGGAPGGGGAPTGGQPEQTQTPAGEYVRTVGLDQYEQEKQAREDAEKAGEPMPEGAIDWLVKGESERSISDATPEISAARDLHVIQRNEDGSYTFTKVDRLTGELTDEKATTDENGKVEIDGVQWEVKKDADGNISGFTATVEKDGATSIKELDKNGTLLASTIITADNPEGSRTVYASDKEAFGFHSVEEAIQYANAGDTVVVTESIATIADLSSAVQNSDKTDKTLNIELINDNMQATYVANYDSAGTLVEEYRYQYNEAGDTTYERCDINTTGYWYEHTYEYDPTDGYLLMESFIDSDGTSYELTFDAQGRVVTETINGDTKTYEYIDSDLGSMQEDTELTVDVQLVVLTLTNGELYTAEYDNGNLVATVDNVTGRRTVYAGFTGFGFASLQDALDYANVGDVVLVNDKTYTNATTGSIHLTSAHSGITLRSLTGEAIIDGGNVRYMFSASGVQNFTMEGFTIKRQRVTGEYYYSVGDSEIDFRNCTFEANNYASMMSTRSILSFTNCKITSNVNNNAMAGFLSNYSSTVTFTDCDFDGNKSTKIAGVIRNDSTSTVLAVNCTFTGNEGNTAGVMDNQLGSDVTIQNCTFTDNAPQDIYGPANIVDTTPALQDVYDGTKLKYSEDPETGQKTIYVGFTNSYFTAIQAALDFAGEGDIVLVDDGTYTKAGGGEIHLTSEHNGITLKSLTGNAIINGANANYMFSASGVENFTMEGFTIRGTRGADASADYYYLTNSEVNFVNCRFEANDYAAMYNLNSNLTFTDCVMYSNNPTNLAGGFMYNNGTATFTRCVFDSNSSSGPGGAIYSAGTTSLIDCVFKSNSAVAGGAIYNGDTLNVENCVFIDNTPQDLYGKATYSRPYELVSGPAWASFNPDTMQLTLDLSDNYDAAGLDYTIRIKTTDYLGNEILLDYVIDVNNVNRPPEATVPATVTGSEGTEISFLITLTDPDGQVTGITSDLMGATLTDNGDGTWQF